MTDIRDQVKDYYSKVTTQDAGAMQTSICSCASNAMPDYLKAIQADLPDEIVTRFYGCGSPIPFALDGCTVLDLGCGTGLDVYILSKLVGESGKVIGVDMNEDQLEVARRYQEEMTERYGYEKTNVNFKQGYIEDLQALGIEDESVDVVVSNCVINLSPEKEAVFQEIWRVLKPGGELYFADIFADRRIPEEVATDPVIHGECLGGAMYIEDFRRLMQKVGWKDYRYTETSTSSIDNPAIEEVVGNIEFTSRTVRAFKLPDLIEDLCEQYGQFATYKGGLFESPHYFDLDDHHRFIKDLPMSVCGNSCAMVENTRFSKYFDIHGDRSQHFGPFDGCGDSVSNKDTDNISTGGCC